ncbi:MAG: iron ABC transporter permease [Coriobacteriales bacterium]|nr:iron ABC transporter permease [Coriobacteriales bacterium]
MISRSRKTVVSVVAAITLLVAAAAACIVGSTSVGLADVFALLTGGEISNTAQNILINVRFPRVAAALLAGSALAVAGVILQGVLDNPLASPNIIGINAGAGFLVLLSASVLPHFLWLPPVAAFVGALISAAFIFLIAMGAKTSRLTVVLAGIAITAIFGAGMNTILIVDPAAYVASSTFLVGGFHSGIRFDQLIFPAVFILPGVLLAIFVANKLNIMALGDQTAHSLGMNVARTRLLLLALAAILAGAAVSIAGLLSFVGLIVPHLMRFFVGHDNRILAPLSAIVGATFVVACDLLARVLFAPYEIQVGIIMAFLGGPFFIYLILKNRRGLGGSHE